jgi:hypothetical protein
MITKKKKSLPSLLNEARHYAFDKAKAAKTGAKWMQGASAGSLGIQTHSRLTAAYVFQPQGNGKKNRFIQN